MNLPPNRALYITTMVLALVLLTACSGKKKSTLVWDKNLYVIGSQSSPRTTDLNGDGVLDMVMGAGKNEEQYSKQGVIAVDGKSGALLWQQEATDQVYGSATFLDVNADQVADVFIGGRSPHFKALDGKSGAVIWTYDYDSTDHPVLRYARYNFNNSILIPDQNQDGVPDLLTVNGGNSRALPGSEEGRDPGVLMVFDSRTGAILAADTMPDGRESYLSPLCFTPAGARAPVVVFGTGGETIGGNLYVTNLPDLMSGRLSQAIVIASETGHGFIAPPTAVDLNDDGVLDIVAISHASTIFAIDGKSHAYLWKQTIAGTECSNSFAVGYFTGDDTPDLFTFVSKGEWPNNTGSVQVMLNGKNGNIEYTDELGCTGFSSPVVYDLNNDGYDEAIISINEFDCDKGFVDDALFEIENKLLAIDFRRASISTIDQTKGFKNIFSTPWLGDLDGDGYLDLLSCQYYSRGGLLTFLGMRVKRIDLPVKVRSAPLWGGYMGSAGDGVFMGNR